MVHIHHIITSFNHIFYVGYQLQNQIIEFKNMIREKDDELINMKQEMG